MQAGSVSPPPWPNKETKAQQWGRQGPADACSPDFERGAEVWAPPAPWVVLMDFCFSF